VRSRAEIHLRLGLPGAVMQVVEVVGDGLIERRQVGIDQQVMMAGVRAVGAGRGDAHAAQAEMNDGFRRDGGTVPQADEIDRSPGRRSRRPAPLLSGCRPHRPEHHADPNRPDDKSRNGHGAALPENVRQSRRVRARSSTCNPNAVVARAGGRITCARRMSKQRPRGAGGSPRKRTRVTKRAWLFLVLLIAGLAGAVRVTLAQPAAAPKPGEVFLDCADCAEMVVVPPGDYEMGGGDTPYEKPQHKVTIAHPFAIGRGEVSFDEWDLCYSAGGCRHRPDDHGWGRGK